MPALKGTEPVPETVSQAPASDPVTKFRTPTFEFVIFCDDLGGVSTVPRIWNTNAGAVFQATVT
jgi:hypothetical protein